MTDLQTIATAAGVFIALVAGSALWTSYGAAWDRVTLERDRRQTRAKLDGSATGFRNRLGSN